jgi:hypothetical protein
MRVRLPSITQIAFGAAFGMLVWIPSAAYAPDQDPPMQRIGSPWDLRPHSAEEETLAEYFDQPGFDLLEVGTASVTDESGMIVVPPAPPGAKALPSDPWWIAVCSAEIILIGHTTSDRALLSKSGSELLTISQLAVDRWVKPHNGPNSVVLATLGGRVMWGKRLISFDVGTPRDLRTPWLLFLKKIPKTTVLGLAGGAVQDVDIAEALRSDQAGVDRVRSIRARIAGLSSTCRR